MRKTAASEPTWEPEESSRGDKLPGATASPSQELSGSEAQGRSTTDSEKDKTSRHFPTCPRYAPQGNSFSPTEARIRKRKKKKKKRKNPKQARSRSTTLQKTPPHARPRLDPPAKRGAGSRGLIPAARSRGGSAEESSPAQRKGEALAPGSWRPGLERS